MDSFLQSKSNMDSETKAFRKNIREQELAPWYNGYLHILINLSLLATVITLSVQQINQLKPIELLTLPFVMLLGNLAVWAIHKYPLHRRWKLFPYAYDVHSKSHHRYYTENDPTFSDHKDFHFMFFPPQVVLAFALLYCPVIFYAMSLLFNTNIAALLVIGSALYFLLYELFHFVSHLPEKNFLIKNVRLFRTMRQHHLIHHRPNLMHRYNFNIVYPLFDWLLGTYYK